MNLPASPTSASPASARLWRGTSRADRDGARRNRLLDAALELYGTIGFRATSIQALCQESGVSSRSFYELFPGHLARPDQAAMTAQESLLEQLYVVLNEQITEALESLAIPAHANLLEATVHLVSTALLPMLDDERKARVLEVEAVGVNDRIEERRREVMRLLAAAVDSAFAQLQAAYRLPSRGASAQGGARATDGGLTSLILVGGITEALVQRVLTPVQQRTSTTAFLTHIAEVALRSHGIGDDWFRLGSPR